jgi:aminoglycoside 6'-N-acetyltransferase
MSMPVLHGERVRLRPAEPDDVARLEPIMSDPSVARWWTAPSAAGAAADWLADDGLLKLVIELDGEVVGSLQIDEETDPDYRHASIDLFLAPAAQDRGLGPDAIRTVARHLIDVRGHHRLTIDPSAANGRAIRAYEKVGFRAIGVMRAYERNADGSWHDNLLMDLLAGELT